MLVFTVITPAPILQQRFPEPYWEAPASFESLTLLNRSYSRISMQKQDPLPSGEASQFRPLKKEVFCLHHIAAVTFPIVHLPGHSLVSSFYWYPTGIREVSGQRLLALIALMIVIHNYSHSTRLGGLVDPRGHWERNPLSAQFLLFSCSFQQKSSQMIGAPPSGKSTIRHC